MIICLGIALSSSAQEWKNLRQFRLQTGRHDLSAGEWLKYDRKNNTTRWVNANTYNLRRDDCAKKYPCIAQKRDLYRWADQTRLQNRHEVQWAGVAYLITSKMAVLDRRIVRWAFVGNRQLVRFLFQSNELILQNIRPELAQICDGKSPMTGRAAVAWDSATIYKEQCIVLDTLYERQPVRVIHKFNRIVNGKGIYALVIPPGMRMHNDVANCKNRCYYGLVTMRKYYRQHVK